MTTGTFNIEELRTLRDRLVDSLALWGSGNDGFYRSSPYSKSTPSFTNTGIVLQAFVESRRSHLAHNLAERLLKAVHSRYAGVFPHEKAQNDHEAHVMCNAWAAFAILDTFPNRVAELATVCDWFLNNQRDGHWSLLPGEETREPIVTGYAVSALQQFHRCLLQASDIGIAATAKLNPGKIAGAIELAVNHLLDARPESIRRQGLYLWPASIGPGATPPLSLGTSALCMHVLAKWGRYRGRQDLVDGVASTLKRLVVAASVEGNSHIEINGHRLAVWDQLHLNEGSINYLWYFFAPISVVTVIQFAEHHEFDNSPELIEFVWRFVEWIKDHVREVDGNSVGISGGETLAEPKVWSTGLSVIVLSRVLERRDLFRLDELLRRKSVEQRIAEVLTRFNQPPPARWVTIGILLLSGLAAVAIFGAISPFLKKESWQEAEGYITAALTLLGIIFGIISLTIAKLRRSLRALIVWTAKFKRAPRVVRELDEILTSGARGASGSGGRGRGGKKEWTEKLLE